MLTNYFSGQKTKEMVTTAIQSVGVRTLSSSVASARSIDSEKDDRGGGFVISSTMQHPTLISTTFQWCIFCMIFTLTKKNTTSVHWGPGSTLEPIFFFFAFYTTTSRHKMAHFHFLTLFFCPKSQ